MPPKRKAQQADLGVSAEPGSPRTPRPMSRVAAVKENAVDAAPVAKRPRGRPPKKSTPKKLPPKASAPKEIDPEASYESEGDIDVEALYDPQETIEEEWSNNTAPIADNGIPGAHPAYKDMLSRDAIVFIFSEAFHDALRDKANDCPRKHGVSAAKAIEEFRRLIAIKTWAVDIDATKISPTPIMDHLWHAAVLDTEFYAQLQSALGVKLRHNPKGASDRDSNNRQKRLTRMTALYKSFFAKEPLVSNPLYVAPVLPIL
ncbi:hypothetical protein PMIN02_008943 [Paraphaeosphaeria minitans]